MTEASRSSGVGSAPRKPASPGVAAVAASGSGAVASPQVQRIAVSPGTPIVGSPQVQRLAFFDSLNQDIAYQQQKQARGGAPQYVEVFVDPEDDKRAVHNASAPPTIFVNVPPSEHPTGSGGGGGWRTSRSG